MSGPILTRTSPLLAADARPSARLQHIGVRFMISGAQTGGLFSVVEHPIDPASLGAPYHTHTKEDEYSIVLEGDVGFALDEQVVVGHQGDTVFKPRNVRHTFWNAGDAPARILEIITPAGFETYFAEVGEVFAKAGPPDVAALASIAGRYGLRMERETAPELIAKHGLCP
jgi:quercetin dioxygenase-like cupin family protein